MKTAMRRGQRGETLTGLLVGLSVGLVVLAAGSALLANHLRGHRMALQDSHLHHDLRSAMDWMARELRKAQYSAHAWETRSPSACNDAFCDGPEDFGIVGDQIEFSHDRNHDGLQDNNECTGFRLSERVIQIKRSCQSGGDWVAITDVASLRVNTLNWQLECEKGSGWIHRSVVLNLTAQWPDDAAGQITLTRRVHLRNDLPEAVQPRFCP